MVAIDKQAHFWWGWAIAATCYPLGLWSAVFFSGAMGAAKELWDTRGHGTPDRMDFAFTMLGGVVGTVVCAAFKAAGIA